MSTIDEILRLTPGDGSQVDEWFIENLKTHIDAGLYPGTSTLTTITENIVEQLQAYKHQHSISDVVIGMSGGVDSATTAALFKQAGWTVHGVTLPIHQKQDETNRGIEAIDTLADRYIRAGKTLHLRHLSEECRQLLRKAGNLVEVNVLEDPRYHVADDQLA